MKQWINFDNESCPDCGGQLLVIADEDGLFGDGDDIKCAVCTFVSATSMDVETGEVWVSDIIG